MRTGWWANPKYACTCIGLGTVEGAYIDWPRPFRRQMKRLAAIVFTDISGFTELSGRDESRALALLDQKRELVFPLLEAHEGK